MTNSQLHSEGPLPFERFVPVLAWFYAAPPTYH